MQVSVTQQGNEAHPVVTIDDAIEDPETWRQVAATLPMQPIGPHYPGIRSVVPQPMTDALCRRIAPLMAQHLGVPMRPREFECFFSLVTAQRASLAPIQRMPHFDGMEPNRTAFLLFLSHRPQGGTAFYRQRATGFESVTPDRFPAYARVLEQGVRTMGLPPPDYIAGDTPLFERVALHAGAFNRALLYRGNMLHSGHLPDDVELSADPMAGRLTLNLFLYN